MRTMWGLNLSGISGDVVSLGGVLPNDSIKNVGQNPEEYDRIDQDQEGGTQPCDPHTDLKDGV